MHASHLLPFLTGITAALTTQPLPREEIISAPPDNSIHIAGVAFAGSGCPAGTLSGGLLPDPSKLTMNYTAFIAETGKGYPVTQSRKNCQLNFKIKYPSGWQFTVAKTNYRGYASMPDGVTGIARSTYYFSGSSAYPMIASMTIKGPYEGDFLKTDQIDVASLIWSPCGTESMININSEVRLDPRNSTGPASLSVTSLEKVELRWHRCTPLTASSSTSTSSQPASSNTSNESAPSSPPTPTPAR